MNNYLDLAIYIYLQSGKTCSASFLADKFDVCKKTIYRHVDNLIFAGLPIISVPGKNGGIKLDTSSICNIDIFNISELEFLNNLLMNNLQHGNTTSKIIIAKIDKLLNKY